MQNRENVDPNSDLCSYNSIALMAEEEEDAAAFNFNQIPHLPQKNQKAGLFSSPTDFFAVDSFHTVDRGSLKIMPELSGIDLQFKNQADVSLARLSSQDFGLEGEQEVIARTLKLCLKSSSESSIKQDLFSDYSPKRHRSLAKNRHRGHLILKNSRQLIRQLKRKAEEDRRIEVDFILYIHKQKLRFKEAILDPIINEKGILSGMVLSSLEDQRRMRFSSHISRGSEQSLEVWDEREQVWQECQFKAYVRSQ